MLHFDAMKLSFRLLILKVPKTYTRGWKWILFIIGASPAVPRVWRVPLPLPQWFMRRLTYCNFFEEKNSSKLPGST